ncbi:BlaI/MecI/CopY family transcriptional regulator [Nocardioides sp.]|jgi:predicted transcriptional regulator|uniref:BlaI/MecI/CopY family transcriptional regulator n=1 Tax=Nocardioides sp. TaxID=35761 RepID=UPI002621B847|nr:BlaI/MecI/CopY family transcriptional regulator [Nocardioides sp.]
MRQLGQLETAVMDRLWTWGRPVSVREVLEDLVRERPLAYTTVMTVMDKLHSKELVSRKKDGKAYLYAAISTREEHTAMLLDEVLAASEDRSAALLHLLDRMDRAEVDELRAALLDGGPDR